MSAFCETQLPIAGMLKASHGIPPLIVAGVTCPNFGRMLGHSLVILMTTYAHYIQGTQDEAARLMDDILTPIPIVLKVLKK